MSEDEIIVARGQTNVRPSEDRHVMHGALKSQKPARKRTRIACLRCRARKVRCDSTGPGVTCTNCRLDQLDCPLDTVRARPRRQSSSSSSRRMGETVGTPPMPPRTQQAPPNSHHHHPATNIEVATDHENSSHILDLYSDGLPSFVRPLKTPPQSSLHVFLRSRGVLSAPPLHLRKALWLAYLRSIHPTLPVLQVRLISSLIFRDEASRPTFSLLLFHAIMFAGMHTVDMRYLLDAGYTSRKACIHECFEIVKLLYDFDYESDRTCLVQTLLIMTLWYRSSDDDKDPWHYVSLAISLAKKMGLHRQATTAAVPEEERALLRRLWWCCVMRDHMIAYGMSRPVHIRLRESDVTVLTTDDFDNQDLVEGLSLTTGRPLEEANSEGHYLAVLFVKLAKLCKIVHEFLEAEDQSGLQPPNIAHGHLSARCVGDDQSSLRKVDAELLAWKADLENHPITSIKGVRERNQTATYYVQHCGLLHMLYHTAVMTVHRRHRSPEDEGSNGKGKEAPIALSRERVRMASREVIAICEMFRRRDLLHGLPMSFMSCLLITCIVTLVEIKSSAEAPRRESLGALSMLWGIMKQLESQVTYIDWSYKVLESACRAAKIPITASTDVEHETTENTNDDEHISRQELELNGGDNIDALADGQISSYADLAMVTGSIPPQDHDPGMPSLPWLEPYEDLLFQLPNPLEEESFFDTDFSFLEDAMNYQPAFPVDEPGTDVQYGAAELTPFAEFMAVDPCPQAGFELSGTEQDNNTTLCW